MKTFAALVATALSLCSCASLHSAYMTNMSAPEGREVKAEASKLVFLAFTFDNEFAFDAKEKLLGQCPGGKVTGVFTTYETFWYVLFTRQVVQAQGVCVAKGS